MGAIDTFRAVHASGLLLPSRSTVTALSLLFEKVYLPLNVEAVRAFSEAYKFVGDKDEISKFKVTLVPADGGDGDPFSSLKPDQRRTALRYVDWSIRFAIAYAQLFGEIFETNAFEGGLPSKVELIRKGGPGEGNTYRASWAPPFTISEGDEELYPRLVADGYVPIVTFAGSKQLTRPKPHLPSTKAMAALLAMKSVEMVFPRTRAANPDLILEAREKLKGHLPQFWSSMFKLTTELRNLVSSDPSHTALAAQAEDLVDSLIRPALLDLKHKLESERRQWFYKILSPVQKGLRLIAANPPLTQQQLITDALVIASDVTTNVTHHLRSIEALKESAGLTYLLELEKMSSTESEPGSKHS